MASGTSAGTLHYVANDAPFPSGITGSLLLVDAGAEYKNYAGDVTRCIPVCFHFYISLSKKESPLN